MTDTAVEITPQEAAPAKTPPEETLPEALGARRIADLMADRTGEPVIAADVEELVAHQALAAVDSFKGWPMYATADALALDADLIRRTVAERVEWQQASVHKNNAAERIGWHWRDVQRMACEGRLTEGRLGRYLIADLDRLASECEGEQHITAQAAAELLEIRPADWKYVEAAGWVQPAETYEKPAGGSRYRTITVALFKLAEVRALR
ncbi:hypothetical protein [Streptomyces longisporoflavus]|uniref:Uncharacterized protein n=1 Tax=Streptomyces longisporoflavus TaxID=28044 RepID=A0ABW7R348_9ACTN